MIQAREDLVPRFFVRRPTLAPPVVAGSHPLFGVRFRVGNRLLPVARSKEGFDRPVPQPTKFNPTDPCAGTEKQRQWQQDE